MSNETGKVGSVRPEHEDRDETIFVFVDEGVVCSRCNESVPPGSILPCRCIRKGTVNALSSIDVGRSGVNR